MNDTGGPVYPTPVHNLANDGMVLRDYFAVKAMPWVASDIPGGNDFYERVAALSYALADAMLEARK